MSDAKTITQAAQAMSVRRYEVEAATVALGWVVDMGSERIGEGGISIRALRRVVRTTDAGRTRGYVLAVTEERRAPHGPIMVEVDCRITVPGMIALRRFMAGS